MSAVVSLREYLAVLEPGAIIDSEGLLKVLVPAWSSLEGCDLAAMHDGKLARLENPRWEPPHLHFDMERHGATVNGSIYAEVQGWDVDIESGTIEVLGGGRRRVGKAAPKLDVKAIALEVADAIRTGSDDPRIQATRGGFKVLVGECLPSAVKQTMEARRRRFYAALDAEMAGWVRQGNTYRPT